MSAEQATPSQWTCRPCATGIKYFLKREPNRLSSEPETPDSQFICRHIAARNGVMGVMETSPGFLPIPALFVAILFLYSGIGKLSSQQTFIESLLLVPFLPHQLSSIAGAAIPVAEILIGVFLFWNIGWAKIAAIILLSLFASVALLAVSRNQRVPCNCFGTESSEFLSKATVIRNTALALALSLTLDVPEARQS